MSGGSSGIKRLQAILQPLMLRRLKSDQNEFGQKIVELPPRTFEVHHIKFSKEEKLFYDELFAAFQSVFVYFFVFTIQVCT